MYVIEQIKICAGFQDMVYGVHLMPYIGLRPGSW